MANTVMAKKGQKVKVVDCLYGHDFPIGSVVVCTEVGNITGGCFDYEDGSDFWWMEPEEYVILE